MKKLILGVALAVAAQCTFAQSAIVRGEVSAGSYENIQSTTQALNVNVKSTTGGAALADGVANPTVPVVGADNNVFNGTTWDRWRSSSLTNGTGIAKVTIAGVGDPCLSSETPKSSVVINITTATTTQLVALSGSTIIYVCSVNLTISQVATTANILSFVYGTGASCGTGQTILTGGFGTGGITAAAPLVLTMGASGGTLFKSAAGNALCAATTIGGSAAFTGVLTYVQQ